MRKGARVKGSRGAEEQRGKGAGERGNAVLKASAWVLLGALLTLFLVMDPLAVSPVDGWLGVERHEVGHGDGDGYGDGLWTCGMHPEVIEEEPGICPICHMDLTPLRSEGDQVAHGTTHGEDEYTCTLHPMIVESESGECPICGADLVQSGHGDGNGHGTVVTIDPAVQQNMNVVARRVTRGDIRNEIRTVGYLEYDQERMVSVTTKYPGFIEKTYVNVIGERVRTGQPLFEIYSPELVQTEQELLAALRYAESMASAPPDTRERARALVEAARQRLRYWDISDEQIRRLESSGEVFRTLTVLSPANGVIMKRMAGLEGMAARPGMELLHIADLSNLWLTVEIFDHQLPWLDVGSQAVISLSYLPGETFTGRVRSIEPEVEETTRTVGLTLDVPNPGERLRVGMYATVVFAPVAARDALTVPAEAVIRTGQRDLVVLALGGGRFVPREVVLGPRSNGALQVLEGLEDGDEVVTSAQFLIDSESNLREAIAKLVAERRGGS